MTAAALGLSGCASTKAHNTESLLSAAGFHTMTPSTAQQQACYAALPPFKVQLHDFNGKVVYASADKKAGNEKWSDRWKTGETMEKKLWNRIRS